LSVNAFLVIAQDPQQLQFQAYMRRRLWSCPAITQGRDHLDCDC